MSRKLPDSYPMYDSVYGSEVPTEQYFVIRFDTLPSKLVNSVSYDPSVGDYLLSIGFQEESNIFSSNRRYDLSAQILYVNYDKKMMIRLSGSTSKDKDPLVMMDISYDIKLGKISDQIDFDKIKTFERAKKKANIQLVKVEHGHMDTEEFDLHIPPIDLGLNYGSDFLKVHEAIVERLNKSKDSGIILLHGHHGTGKTSYIKHLTGLVKEKDILFIPPSMAEMLSDPSIIPFLMDHKNSILIIEDAEKVISDRESNGSSVGVSNILNLTDGILGDCLNIQIIATFNMKREKIDAALLRKGRLIAEHKFEKLSVEDSNKLLKHLEKDHEVSESMSLADIYNIDVELFKTSNKNKIGFNN